MSVPGGRTAKRLAVEIAGWLLLVVGIAAIPLPGPGWLMIFGAIAILSQRYTWAERLLDSVRYRALKGAADSVETWPRIVGSTLASLALIACGVLWINDPPVASWWPDGEVLGISWSSLWLPGGLWTGIIQIASGLFAIGMIIYSYRRFRGHPEEVAKLDRRIDEAEPGGRDFHEDEQHGDGEQERATAR